MKSPLENMLDLILNKYITYNQQSSIYVITASLRQRIFTSEHGSSSAPSPEINGDNFIKRENTGKWGVGGGGGGGEKG